MSEQGGCIRVLTIFGLLLGLFVDLVAVITLATSQVSVPILDLHLDPEGLGGAISIFAFIMVGVLFFHRIDRGQIALPDPRTMTSYQRTVFILWLLVALSLLLLGSILQGQLYGFSITR